MPKDYYKILGVERGANDEEIKKAYRKLAHQYHPDKAHGDEAKFKEINEAYQVLSDKTKRAHYDQFGTAEPMGGTPGGGFDWSGGGFPFGADVNFTDVNEIFESIFEGMGVRPRRPTYQQGSDLEVLSEITLEEAYHGVTKTIAVNTFVRCEICKGEGGDPGAGFKTCETCNGRGEVREQRKTFFGNFAQVRPCVKCHGAGRIPNKICENCRGLGRVRGERQVRIEIMRGIEDGQIIHVKGAGEVGERGASAGDLYVRVRVKKHPIFRREGSNLLIYKEISVFDILLGRKVEVAAIDSSTVSVEIPEHFNLKDPLKIRGKGMSNFGAFGHGDLLVEIVIKAPKKLSSKQKKLLEDLEKDF